MTPEPSDHLVYDLERLAEPSQMIDARTFMGGFSFMVAVVAEDRVCVRGSGWAQGFGRFGELDSWTEHASRSAAVQFVREQCQAFLLADPVRPLDPIQAKSRDALLERLMGAIDDPYQAVRLPPKPPPPTQPGLPVPPLDAVVERDPAHPDRLRLTLDGLYSFEVTRSADGSAVTLDLLTHDDRFSEKSLTVDEGDLVTDSDDE